MNDDLISRQAAIDFIKHEQCKNCSDIGLCENCAVFVALRLLEKVPSAQPKQKPGRWIPSKYTDTVLCSECKKCYGDEFNFCPNCGAKNGDGGVDMDRHLDGIYLRIERNGKFQAVCLSDMTREELETNLDPSRGEWLKGAVIHLARTLSDIGEMLDLEAKIDDE